MSDAAPSVPEIDVDELERQSDVPLIDVRQPDEYEAGHVPGAKLIPLDEVPERVAEIQAEGRVNLICGSGPRSHRAAEYLIAQGVDATNVVGGTKAWVESGRSVTAGSEPG